MSRPLVVIATPCFGGQVGIGYMNSILRLMAAVGDRIGLAITQIGGDALITRARALLVAEFLDNPGATHLLFVDGDIAFEATQFERLFAQDKDFTGAMYPVKRIDWTKLPGQVAQGEPVRTAGLEYVGGLCTGDALRVENQFATANYAGTGFMLLKRRVLEQLVAAHPELAFRSIHGTVPAAGGGANQFALFDPMIDPETGAYLSEDFAFCRRWRALGGTIWLDLRSQLTHSGSADFSGDTAVRYLPGAASAG
jgi:hypothetical protein